ncbi:hypothetical protein OPV22_011357 [Ensete ventricosum]|uniref:Uncharacterized protein n=1 Tax=Ensete ventricosum TaxID=4639 RepID=A0AAV8RFI1_ENSVE|nr:hypothetical protein OPV22_011357 [Ensete ventricosum]
MIDTGSFADILYFDKNFEKLNMTNKDLTPMTLTLTLTGFTRDAISPVGVTTLPVTFSDEPRTKTLIVVELPSAYTGQPTLNKLRAVLLTYHHSMKFPTSTQAGEVRNDPRESRQCYQATTIIHKKVKKEAPVLDPREPGEPDSQLEPTEPILEVPLDKDSLERTIRVGSALPKDQCV